MSGLLPGDEVDHYRVMRLLGRGGMGEVYLARDTKLGRKVALKIIRPERLRSRRAVSGFLREARTTAKFSHPNIVAIYGVGECRGSPYVALEYIEGQDLDERLGEQAQLSAPEAIRIGIAIAEALQEAHRHGVQHRDLKPANVLLARDGRVRVLDFGLAGSIAGTEDDIDSMERASVEAGTPLYMAPEQWRRELGSDRTDVWALGLILFEAVTGRLPHETQRPKPITSGDSLLWEGETALPPPIDAKERLDRLRTLVVSTEPMPGITDSGEFPHELGQLIARCLEKDPSKRPNAAEVAEALRRLQRGDGERATSPFRGLLPFTEEHAALFFGRDAELDAFMERARHDAVLPIVGPSGVGKSSFVQAGVIPRLREQGPWRVVSMRPGMRPIETLAARLSFDPGSLQSSRASGERESLPPVRTEVVALAARIAERPRDLSLELRALAARHGVRVLLFIDQFEELFTQGQSDETMAAFIEAVCSAADDPSDPIRVILTLRDDFLGRLAVSPVAREVLTRVTLIQPMGKSELESVLRRPIAAFGYRFEDEAMIDQMVEAAGAEPASLPLLQFAAQKLWEKRDDQRRLLLRAAHDAMGGVEGALAKHADGVLEALEPQELAAARELLLRLVTPERTRRVITRSAALEGLGAEAERVLTHLVRARLLVARKAQRRGERTRLELAHESLIRSWSTLSRWLDESKDDLAFLSEAQQAAELWDKRGRRAEELWQGDALHEAQRMRARCTTKVPELVDAFLAASGERETSLKRRRRLVTLSLSSLLAVVATGATIAALIIGAKEREARSERDRAEEQTRLATRQHAEALREAAGAALNEGRLLEARAKLRMALEIEDTQPARALWWRLDSDALVWEKALGGLVYDVDMSPDGTTVAAANQDHSVYLLDVRTLEARVLRGHRDQVMALAYSPDGATLATGSWDGSIHVWDARTGALRHRLDGHPSGVRCMRFDEKGTLASGGHDDGLRIWQLSGKPSLIANVDLEGCGLKRIDVHGERIAAACEDGARLVDARSGTRIAELTGHQGAVRSVAFSPDGTQLATAGADSTVRIWSVNEQRELSVLRGHLSGVAAVTFSPDGRQLASSGADRSVRLWDLALHRTVRLYLGHRAQVSSVAFSPDGSLLATAGRDRTVRLWDNVHGRADLAPGGHTDSVYGLAFHPDGATLASSSRDGNVRLWNVASGVNERLLEGPPEGLREVRFSPDGHLLASAGYDNRVRLWKLDGALEPRVLADHGDIIYGIAFDPRGGTLVSGSYDRTLRLVDVASGRNVAVMRGHEAGIRDVRFSPDGAHVASASIDGSVRLWDAASHQEQRVLGRHEGAAHAVAFSPDGRRVVSGGVDGAVRLWGNGTKEAIGRHDKARIYGLSFHPDGEHVASASSDGTARIWSLHGEREVVLRGHRGEVNVVAFSPDGSLVATGSDDHTVRLWHTRDGQPAWRAPVLLDHPPRLVTHMGWIDLDRDSALTAPDKRWRKALDGAAFAASRGEQLCLYRGGKLEHWNMARDERVGDRAMPVIALAASGSSCAAIGEGRAFIMPAAELDLRSASALSATEDRFFIAAADKVHVFDAGGKTLDVIAATVGATAVAAAGDTVVVGYGDGNVSLLTATPRSLQRTPSSAVVRILSGPAGTLVVGHANGTLGLYNASDGSRLAEVRLHGPVSHLLLEGMKLYAATELGRHLVWDLSALEGDWCSLLDKVWKRVPIVWRAGRAIVEAPRVKPECAR